MSRCGSACPTIPACPPASFDRIFLVHMYHEVEQPYPFLWHLRDGLKPGGLVVVVDARTAGEAPRHAARAAAMRIRQPRADPSSRSGAGGGDNYMALYQATGARPEPAAIRPCAMKG